MNGKSENNHDLARKERRRPTHLPTSTAHAPGHATLSGNEEGMYENPLTSQRQTTNLTKKCPG